MASSSRPLLTLFPDLNESTREITGAVALEPQPSAPEFAPLNFPMRSVEQRMAVQSDVEANQYTLKSCVETMTAVTNLSNRLQSRANEVQQLNSQLALLQRMYKDAYHNTFLQCFQNRTGEQIGKGTGRTDHRFNRRVKVVEP
ncbi:hypothetical protein CsSME_00039234 [Camellia sinensis var. sinensis]